VRISATTDYALRAAAEIATRAAHQPVTAEEIATAQGIPSNFLRAILGDLRRAGIVGSVRGQEGGWQLARPAETITLAEIVRVVDGPLASVQGARPEAVSYPGPAAALQLVWVAVRASLREVLEAVTVADLAANRLPEVVLARILDDEAWRPH
jgi:Rrf2 family protein